MFPFDPPKNIRKTFGFLMFQGDQKGTLERKGLNHILCLYILPFTYGTLKSARFPHATTQIPRRN